MTGEVRLDISLPPRPVGELPELEDPAPPDPVIKPRAGCGLAIEVPPAELEPLVLERASRAE